MIQRSNLYHPIHSQTLIYILESAKNISVHDLLNAHLLSQCLRYPHCNPPPVGRSGGGVAYTYAEHFAHFNGGTGDCVKRPQTKEGRNLIGVSVHFSHSANFYFAVVNRTMLIYYFVTANKG